MVHLQKADYTMSLCLHFWLKSLISQGEYVPQEQMNTSLI